jgi:hypothetical protein
VRGRSVARTATQDTSAEIIVSGAWNLEADRLRQTMPLYREVGAAIRRAAAAQRVRVADMFAALDGP